jgi:3-carboxy-cis,cis-muconate cycloisomerase
MSVSIFDHPILSRHFGDDEIASFFSIEADIAAMLTFELALAEAQALEGVISGEAAAAISEACEHFAPDFEALREGVARDGLIVPELVRELRKGVAKPHDAAVHFGVTSQDVIDTGLVLRLKSVVAALIERIEALMGAIDLLGERHGERSLMGRTRMQAAIPVTVLDRVRSWRMPLARALDESEDIRPELLQLQLGGAAGTLDKLGEKGPLVAQRLGFLLDLEVPPANWHSQRDSMVRFAGWLSLITGALGKLGQDVALMAQNGIDEIRMAGGGTSSAMPHKQNPVKAETLVALARFNATQVSGMHHALVHEQERSGAAWSLEWMILPQMAVAAGASLRLAGELVDSIADVGDRS